MKPRGASRKGPNRLLATHYAERVCQVICVNDLGFVVGVELGLMLVQSSVTRRRRGCGNVEIPRLLRDFQVRHFHSQAFSRFLRRAGFCWLLMLVLGMECRGSGHFPSLAYPRRKNQRWHYANLSGRAMRSGHRTAKKFNASLQFFTGIVHFLDACRIAKNSNFSADSWLGNATGAADGLVTRPVAGYVYSANWETCTGGTCTR